MRYIAIILSVYLLVLAFMPSHGSMMPCGSSCCDIEMLESSNTDSTEESTEKSSCPSQCASFCCNVITAISPKTMIPLEFMPTKPFVENSFHYNSPKGISFLNIVWQPPQKVL